MRTLKLFILLSLFSLSLAACGNTSLAQTTDVQPDLQEEAGEAEAPNAVSATEAALVWQGMPLNQEAGCATLRLTAEGQALTGACETKLTPVEFHAEQPGGWNEIMARFAPFQDEIGGEQIEFAGRGDIDSPAWRRAVAAWARFTQAELASGRVGAANRTVLSWWLGEDPDQPGLCRHLVVLNHGYAYRSLAPCEGGPDQDLITGWIDTAAWEQFDAWFYDQAPVYQDNNYFSGAGESEMDQAEVSELAAWAESVYAELAPTSDSAVPQPDEESAVGCPEATAETQLLVDEANGYCLLYPAEYTPESTDPAGTNLVIGSVMNHTDPRASLMVEDAAGRTLEQVAEQLAADYTLPGMESPLSRLTVAGVEAVMLDNLPGQDLNRRVVFIHNGRLYNLFFTPLGEEGSDTAKQMETLYRQVVDSFHLID